RGLGVLPVLPDRALPSRRGAPRGPAAGIHADRPGDVLRDRGRRVRRRGGDAAVHLPPRPRPGAIDAVPAHHLRRGDGEVRERQARPPRSVRDPGRDGDRRPGRLRGVPRRAERRAEAAERVLGLLRTQVGNASFKLDDREFRFVWVHRFPLFEWLESHAAWGPAHHIFTMPLDEDLPFIESDPGRVRAQLYDLAANGNELASGSIRLHRNDIHESVMRTIGMKAEQAQEKFGFLLEAFEYGAPPHGGIALGLDRLVVLFNGGESIRDAIAFPKTASATSLMDGAPAPIDPKDLNELKLRIAD